MRYGRLRRRCVSILERSGVVAVQPFDLNVMLEAIAIRRGKPIHRLAADLPVGLSGLWLATPSADYICYEQSTTKFHQLHIIFHEIGHIICDHGSEFSASVNDASPLAEHTGPDPKSSVLYRSDYSRVEEQEAEMIASLLLRDAASRSPTQIEVERRSPDDAVIARVAQTLVALQRQQLD